MQVLRSTIEQRSLYQISDTECGSDYMTLAEMLNTRAHTFMLTRTYT